MAAVLRPIASASIGGATGPPATGPTAATGAAAIGAAATGVGAAIAAVGVGIFERAVIAAVARSAAVTISPALLMIESAADWNFAAPS
jgi:hypothetical protein